MSEALLGVIIGGAIAILTPVINIILEQKRWKKVKRIDYLHNQKMELEKRFKEIGKKLDECMLRNSYPCDMLAMFMEYFPKTVYDAFDSMMCDKTKNKIQEKISFHLLNIQRAMHKALRDIEEKIENELNYIKKQRSILSLV